jgi:nucleoid DNA-binding protein
LNRSELINRVWSALPYEESQQRVTVVLNSILEEIASSLNSGETVKIRDFGTFFPVERAATRRKIPGEKQLRHIPPRRTIGFRASPHLSQKKN